MIQAFIVRMSILVVPLLLLAALAVSQERTDVFVSSRDHPAIAYTSAPTSDRVALLNQRLSDGAVLQFDERRGYLGSVLDMLGVPVESQVLVFSQTSAQAERISMASPRAIYFDEAVAVGWVPGADVLELAAHDSRQGVVFYTLPQKRTAAPRFERQQSCLLCHLTWETLGVPGMTMISTFPMSDDPHAYASGVTVDHRTPLQERWGGWYVSGQAPSTHHLGNRRVVVPAAEYPPPRLPSPAFESLDRLFDARDYPSACSDIVGLLVLSHQVHATNLITRLGWEARLADSPAAPRVREAIAALVDYLLFVDEAPFAVNARGACGFDRRFAATGPRDRQGRSLRDFDLSRRLFKYPCSYMIYSAAFDALPAAVRMEVFSRMRRILSGEERAERYATLSAADRRAVATILRETKPETAAVFAEMP